MRQRTTHMDFTLPTAKPNTAPTPLFQTWTSFQHEHGDNSHQTRKHKKNWLEYGYPANDPNRSVEFCTISRLRCVDAWEYNSLRGPIKALTPRHSVLREYSTTSEAETKHAAIWRFCNPFRIHQRPSFSQIQSNSPFTKLWDEKGFTDFEMFWSSSFVTSKNTSRKWRSQCYMNAAQFTQFKMFSWSKVSFRLGKRNLAWTMHCWWLLCMRCLEVLPAIQAAVFRTV